jgi:alkanesulfonate monooxygenase SsuD/methylene tetrahydromethanopterin reductase-like flavin-dependent oxidoreductase (luciferase family)
MTPTLGAVFRPQLPPERLRAVAEAADEAGLDELWLWEDCFWTSGVASAAAALAWTDRLQVGVGLLPVPLRNVAITAMELATLHRLFPGRPVIGVGHGVQDWMGQVGARVESPMTLLREYLTALRGLLDGQTATAGGRYVRLQGVALDWPPAPPPPVLAGAVGPRTVALSGEVADGTILTAGTTPGRVREVRALLDEARTAAGRSQPHTLTVYVHAATGTGAEQRMSDELRAQSQDPSDAIIAGGVPLADVALVGDADAIAAGVTRWARAGADAVILQPTADEPDIEGFIRVAAEQVGPRLAAAPARRTTERRAGKCVPSAQRSRGAGSPGSSLVRWTAQEIRLRTFTEPETMRRMPAMSPAL